MAAWPVCYVSLLLLIAFFNVPGSVHDSQVAESGNIYSKLEGVFLLTRAKCFVDSAIKKCVEGIPVQILPGSFGFFSTHRKLHLWKKGGNISMANSRVGNVHVAEVFFMGEGSRERSKGYTWRCWFCCIMSMQGWLGSIRFRIRTWNTLCKMQTKMFLLIVICFARSPWAWEVPLKGRKGGPQESFNLPLIDFQTKEEY